MHEIQRASRTVSIFSTGIFIGHIVEQRRQETQISGLRRIGKIRILLKSPKIAPSGQANLHHGLYEQGSRECEEQYDGGSDSDVSCPKTK